MTSLGPHGDFADATVTGLQVQWNLFGVFMEGNQEKKSPDDMLVPTYYTCREVEENYTKNTTSQDAKGQCPLPKAFPITIGRDGQLGESSHGLSSLCQCTL